MLVNITAYPYATQYGELEVPDDVTDINGYVETHWDDIKFEDPELDYCGTEFDID